MWGGYVCFEETQLANVYVCRMFIPVEGRMGQHIWVVDKDAEGNVKKEMHYAVRYVPLTDPPKA